MSDRLLEARNLSVAFRRNKTLVKAVNDVSFGIERDETLGIVGESGSGKSVTALAIMRLMGRSSRVTGEVTFEGENLLALRERRMRAIRGRRIAMVFQDPMSSLNPLLTIGRQMSEVIELHLGDTHQAAVRRAISLLETVGVPDPAEQVKRYPFQLSGGMRQRVMIAIALSCAPKLLIADEATTALDVTIQAQVIDLVARLRQQFGTAVLWISHDLGVIAGMCDRVNVMYAGRIAESGPVDEVFERPQHPYTHALLRCVPRTDQPIVSQLETVGGLPPDPTRLPTGCAFAPRCPSAMARCIEEYPPWEEHSAGHGGACWAADSLVERRSAPWLC